MASFALHDFAEPEVDSKPDPTLLPGYAEGYADAEAALAQRQGALTQQAVAAFEDCRFSYLEAHGAVLEQLGPLFDALLEKVLPLCVEKSFRTHLVNSLREAAAAATAAPLTLSVAPQHKDAAAGVIAEAGVTLTLRSDAAFAPHQAVISCEESDTSLDLDRLLEDIRRYFDEFHSLNNESQPNG